MDSSFYITSGLIALVFGLFLAFIAWTFLRRFQKMNGLLNRAHEMTGTAQGRISELVYVHSAMPIMLWS